MKRIAHLLFLIFLSLDGYSNILPDVAPDPTIAKGIVPSRPVNIQMVSEIVRARLTLDSSYVECTFHMHNLGGQTDLEVGFPVMNYYMWQNEQISPIDQNKFEVFINGKAINKADTYIPDSLNKIFSEKNGYRTHEWDVTNFFRNYDNLNKPWYLWKMHFKANEYLTIVVRYVLPNGYTKSNMYFDYLLSTGAGWHGKIEDAKIIVTLDNIPGNQVLSVSPKRFVTVDKKRIEWHFIDLKPNLNSDIKIDFEKVKGQRKAFLETFDVTTTYLDNKKVKYSSVDTSQIGYMNFRRNSDNGDDEIIFFSKTYILQKFKDNLKQSNPVFWKQISKLSVQNLQKDYFFEIDGRATENGLLFEKLKEIDTVKMIKGEISKQKYGKRKIVFVSTKEP